MDVHEASQSGEASSSAQSQTQTEIKNGKVHSLAQYLIKEAVIFYVHTACIYTLKSSMFRLD